MKPIAWTIAGTDPSGGAGIQADLKTFHGLGVCGGSAITALIAQNSLGVRRVEFASPDLVEAQLSALREELPPAAVKIGMLGTAATARAVAKVLREMKTFVVYDPVMGASSGHALMSDDLPEAVKSEVLPLVDVLTPNIPEAERLTGLGIRTRDDMLTAAHRLRAMGPRAVMLKGGHVEDTALGQDGWVDDQGAEWLTSPRLPAPHSHGTGCTLSSALAACRALGHEPLEAAVIAKAYVNQGLRLGGGIGRGRGSLAHGGWPEQPGDVPWLTPTAEAGRQRFTFPDEGPGIGLYPLVPRAWWLERMLPLGVRIVQLRAKDLDGSSLDREVARAVDIARRFDAHLYINDRWDLALKHNAWGVHLGQEDLPGADLAALARAGLRLGLSTRSYVELARARAVRPSYVAIGAVYATGSKDLDYVPLGVEAFARLRRWLDAPAVAIGGITAENAPALIAAGADGLAVISDLLNAPDLEARLHAWSGVLRANFPNLGKNEVFFSKHWKNEG